LLQKYTLRFGYSGSPPVASPPLRLLQDLSSRRSVHHPEDQLTL
jgi:hypothetical protein